MKQLDSIAHFGAIDADSDDILIECFEDHEAFKDLLDQNKFLIVGRKGTGKTSIFKKMLTMENEVLFSSGHTFSDYPWHYHDKQARIGVPDHEKYTHSWKYLILLTLSKMILNIDGSLPCDDNAMEEMSKIERFVIDTYGSRDPDITQIFSPTKVLNLKSKFQINLPLIKAEMQPESVPIEYLPTIFPEVNNNLLLSTFCCLNPDHRYYICFDQLDLGFNPTDSNYYTRLIGLLLACKEINNKAREDGKNLFICVFLRDDIYNDLHFEDKNKITVNSRSIIEWDTRRTQKTLKALMEKRFRRLLAENDAERQTITWDQIFDETQAMTGHQTKYQYILDRTFLRPRDIIQFCNEILKKYKSRISNNPTDNLKFNNMDVNMAKTEFSNYFLEELDDEIHKHIPNYKNYLELFKVIGVMQFSKDTFVSEFDEKRDSFAEITDPLTILKELFEFSVIGYYKVGGRGFGGSEWIYKYKEPQAQFDELAPKFKLHPGFMDALGLKKFSKSI